MPQWNGKHQGRLLLVQLYVKQRVQLPHLRCGCRALRTRAAHTCAHTTRALARAHACPVARAANAKFAANARPLWR